MPKTTLTLIVTSVLLIIAQACAPSGMAPPDPSIVNTVIAQTAIAAATLTSQPGIPVTGPDTPTATQTLSPSPEPPTSTTTALILPSPISTSTATVPQIRVSVPTNCRVGPGRAFTRVGGLQVGEVAEVVARSAFGDYWIIRDPNRPNVVCWLWGEYATVTGDTNFLPIYTPPPSPTPLPTATSTLTAVPMANFTASYNGLESCTGTGWWLDFELENTGGVTLQSMSFIVSDTVTGTVLPLDTGNLTDRNGCNETDTRSNLPVGDTRTVSSPVFLYDPTGNRLYARITLCSDPGLNGTCRTQQIQFTP